MKKPNDSRTGNAGAVWLPIISILLGLLLPATSHAGKAGGGGSGTGTIYFDSQGHANAMNADGSGKTALPAGVWGSPGRLLHGGKRWFLRTANSPDWSPDSAFLLYTKDTSGGWIFAYDVYRVGAGGGSQVNLTSDMSYEAIATAWR